MLPFLVDMVVFVPFGEMGPQAKAHQRAGDEQLDGRQFVQEDQSQTIAPMKGASAR